MRTTPLSDRCRSALEKREHVCFGISPFNSYFSEARIRDLAAWGLNHFETMSFFVPDVPAAYTLEALGYAPEKAAWKARRQSQYLKNKITRALTSLGITPMEAAGKILDWDRLMESQRFRELYADALERYAADLDFQDRCIEASNWVLEKRLEPGQLLTPMMLESAVRYFLAEIPLFLDTAGIVGASSSVFCYHQTIPFLTDLYARRLSIAPSEGQGFLVVQSLESTAEDRRHVLESL